jgi:uncharacterized protein with GYD domain
MNRRAILVCPCGAGVVKVRGKPDDLTVQTAEFDPMGRRMKKVVTSSGDYDAAVVYLYNGDSMTDP